MDVGRFLFSVGVNFGFELVETLNKGQFSGVWISLPVSVLQDDLGSQLSDDEVSIFLLSETFVLVFAGDNEHFAIKFGQLIKVYVEDILSLRDFFCEDFQSLFGAYDLL